MDKWLTLGCLVASMLPAQPLFAGGLITKFPEDGTWATYQLTGIKTADFKDPIPGSVDVRLSLVGTSQEKGVTCRWLELKRSEPNRMVIQKILVPEKHLKRGENPLKHVVRGWRKVGDNEPRPFKKEEIENRWFMYLPGKLTNVKKLEAESIDSGLGVFDCVGKSGKAECQLENKLLCTGQFTARLHSEADFGVMQWQASLLWKGQRSGKVKHLDFVMKLTAQGNDAQSDLPKHE